LEMPVAVRTALDVNRVVEVAGRFAVDRYDGQVAKIFATGALGFADRLGALLRFLQDFARERMRPVMFANDDLGVDAQVAGPAQNFDDPPGGRGATSRVAGQLGVDDG